MFQDIRRSKKSLKEVLPKKTPVEVSRDLYQPRRPRSAKILSLIAVVVFLVFLVYIIGSLFSRATVEIAPVQSIVNFANDNISVTAFQVMSLPPLLEERELVATGSEEVERRASGQLTIYNNHSSAPQSLIKDTRFETSDGKIFRIAEGVTVPGYRVVEGETRPGEITVTVHADQPGEDYNVSPTTFHLPGFAGRPQYETIYARSETPFGGGFKGVTRTVSATDRERAVEDLRQVLTDRATSQVSSQVPELFVYYPGGLFVEFEEDIQEGGSSDRAKLLLKATPRALIFERRSLTEKLVGDKVSEMSHLRYRIENLTDLDVALVGRERINLDETSAVTLVVSGQAKVVAEVELEKLRRDLAGIHKRRSDGVFLQFPSIKSAKAHFRPPWNTRFPTDPKDINIKLLTHFSESASIVP